MKPLSELTNLDGKTAIVTGGAMGIGLGIVKRLAEAGANVVVADLEQDKAEAACREFGENKTVCVRTDVSSADEINNMVSTAVDKFGGLDILVNNAGIYPNKLVMDMDEAEFQKVLDVNLKSVYLATKAAAEKMIEQGRGGKVINITSIDALHPSSAGLAHYDASKHGVWGFTKNVALELAPHQIWVNAIAPGGIATPGVENAQQGAPQGVDMKQMIEAFMNRIPMKRMGEPDEIGRVALFLASDLSSYMTGTQVVVDGGVLLA